jgi:hypothetical protein
MQSKLSWLIEMVSHLMLEEDFHSCSLYSLEVAQACGTGGSAGKDNITILQLK